MKFVYFISILFVFSALLRPCNAVAQKIFRIDKKNTIFVGRVSVDSQTVRILNTKPYDFDNVDLGEGTYNSEEFKKSVAFSNDHFDRYTDFHGADFDDTVRFNDTQFDSSADFASVTFSEIAEFFNMRFNGDIDFFYDSIYVGNLDWFYKNRCNGKAKFSFDVFSDNTNYSYDTFYRSVTFKGASFKGISFFENIFFGNVDFSTAHFPRGASFFGCIFKTKVDFSDLRLTDSTKFNFEHVGLPCLIDFSHNPLIHYDIDFTAANFDSVRIYADSIAFRHCINFFGTDISKVKIDYLHFRLCFYNNRLAENEFHFNGDSIIIGDSKYYSKDEKICSLLYRNKKFRDYLFQVFPYFNDHSDDTFFPTFYHEFTLWSNPADPDAVICQFIKSSINEGAFPRRLSDEEIASVYEKVLKNFEIQGQKDSRQKLDIESNDFKYGWFILPHLWNAYGYHKEWVFYWTIILLVIFTIITSIYFNSLINTVYKIEHIPLLPNHLSSANRRTSARSGQLRRRLWYSFVYTSAIFFLFSLKVEKIKFRNWKGVIYLMIVYTSGIICIAYMANFVLQK